MVSLVSFTCLIISQGKFLLLNPWLVSAYSLFLVFTVAYYFISLAVNFGASSFDVAAHRVKVAAWLAKAIVEGLPPIDVMLPIAGEPTRTLRNTWHYVAMMMKAYTLLGGEITAYVLDDGQSPEAAELVAEFRRAGANFEYHTRPPVPIYGGKNIRGWFKKAGNLKFGFLISRKKERPGKYLLVFDADFCPREDYLTEMLPYLEGDPRLGIIQSPQYFHVRRDVQNWLQSGAGAVQELFYRFIQQSRNQLDGAICVGTNAIYRREALEENGGGPTLIGHSEDVHTGFDLRYLSKTGWGLFYLPINLATGECPDMLVKFIQQQYRWCMGSMSLLGSRKFWAAKMSFRTRCCYLSGFCYYLHTAIFTIVGPTIPIVLLLVFPDQVLLENYLWILPSLIYNMVIFPAWHRCRYGIDAWAVKLVYGWAHAFALMDILRDKRLGWSATGSKKGSTSRRIKYSRTLIGGWGFGTGLIWVGGSAYYMAAWSLWDFLPNLLTGLVYVAVTLRAVTGPVTEKQSQVQEPKPQTKRVRSRGRHARS
ncbi:MAG TPA: glycosyltransferase family 2 protein [Candidatus Saccharimonadales bacterium]|nr:glycosyltransferase family 2 protein [Candidatus Saccharimonadales bacterium]